MELQLQHPRNKPLQPATYYTAIGLALLVIKIVLLPIVGHTLARLLTWLAEFKPEDASLAQTIVYYSWSVAIGIKNRGVAGPKDMTFVNFAKEFQAVFE